jgi:hypothetical protein
MKAITIWKKFNEKEQVWKHNHIQDGHVVGNKPLGNKEQTTAWSKGTWMFFHKYLDSNQVII